MSAHHPAAAPGVPVVCGAGCGRTWPQDPPYEVACPACGANPGARCRRPSGHSGPYVAFHAARDLAAFDAGHYGGPCCQTDDAPDTDPATAQTELFANP